MLHGSDRSGKYLRFLPGSERRYLRREVRREKKRERRAIATWEREHGKWD